MEVGDANAFQRRAEVAIEPLREFTRDRQKHRNFSEGIPKVTGATVHNCTPAFFAQKTVG